MEKKYNKVNVQVYYIMSASDNLYVSCWELLMRRPPFAFHMQHNNENKSNQHCFVCEKCERGHLME